MYRIPCYANLKAGECLSARPAWSVCTAALTSCRCSRRASGSCSSNRSSSAAADNEDEPATGTDDDEHDEEEEAATTGFISSTSSKNEDVPRSMLGDRQRLFQLAAAFRSVGDVSSWRLIFLTVVAFLLAGAVAVLVLASAVASFLLAAAAFFLFGAVEEFSLAVAERARLLADSSTGGGGDNWAWPACSTWMILAARLAPSSVMLYLAGLDHRVISSRFTRVLEKSKT